MKNPDKIGFGHFEALDFELKSVVDVANEANLRPDEVDLLLENGLQKIPIAEEGLSGAISKALKRIENQISDTCQNIKAIYLLHSISGMILDNEEALATCSKGTIFEKIPIVPISGQPCSIFHYGIQLAQKSLKRNDEIILIGVDIAQSAKQRFFFGSAMGDSLIYGNFNVNNVTHNVKASYSDTFVIADNGRNSSESTIERFRSANPTFIRNSIDTILAQTNLQMSEIDWIIPHTPYLKIGQILSGALNISHQKFIMDYISETAHLNSNDSFYHYLRGCKEGKISKNDVCILINPGFGGTRGVTILQYGEKLC